MRAYFITFRSVTYAQRAERALSRGQLRCHLRRTPRWMEERGCGYGVEVRAVSLAQPLELLRREEIPHRKCYRIAPDGTVEEETDALF